MGILLPISFFFSDCNVKYWKSKLEAKYEIKCYFSVITTSIWIFCLFKDSFGVVIPWGFLSSKISLKILTGKKYHQIELQRLQKVWIWTFGSLVQQINSLLLEVLTLKQNFQNNKVVTGKTPFFVIDPFFYSSLYSSENWSLIWQFCMEMMGFQS